MIDGLSDVRERLHARATGVVDAVLRRYVADGSLDSVEAEDVRSTVMLRIVQRFEDQESAADIRSLDDFVAMMTHNAARDVFRGRRPARTRLNKRVQAIVREDERFLVQRDGATWCMTRAHAAAPRVETVALDPEDVAAARLLPLDGVVAMLLERAGGAIRFERLVDLVAEVMGEPLDGERAAIEQEELVDPTPAIETQLIARESLAALWNEIRALPLPQRTALLLHLRDDRGASAIPLLAFTGTATLDEIGAALQLDRPRMEQLWDELPLADLDIAALLETTRSHVIGLRRAARERLGRFLRRGGESA